MKRRRWIMLALACAIAMPVGLAAQDKPAPKPNEISPVVEKAVAYLRAHQEEDGSFSKQLGGPGITALVTAGLLRNGYGPQDPTVAKALKYLEKNVQKDGGVYQRGLANYTTCVALLAFKEANADGRYDTILKNAAAFLKSLQFDESHQFDPSKPEYGGAGYDGKSRPDLSNTHFMVEALRESGLPADDPALKRALAFISRCQNLPGEYNDQPFAKKVSDEDRGGFIYTPVRGGQSGAGESPNGGLRSSGMTYAGLKSFIHAGVDRNDPRVQEAVKWIKRNYSLEENVGQGKDGLFYYYHTFAKALDALGQDVIEDAKGKKHQWRRDLFEAIKAQQKPDGSWSNVNGKFFEGDSNLCTAFALLSLSYCREPRK